MSTVFVEVSGVFNGRSKPSTKAWEAANHRQKPPEKKKFHQAFIVDRFCNLK
jgi:hypothetical protein